MQVLLHSSSSSLLPRSLINSSNSPSKLITLSKQLLQGFSHRAGGSSSQSRLKKKQKSSSSTPFCVFFPASATSRATTTAMARGGWASEAATSNASSSEAFSMPQAELCANDAQCVSVEELEGVEGLTQWLRERLISGAEQLKTWGTAPGTKRVANLWTELVDGEISLADARPPKRTVHVASVKIRNESGLYLVESHQNSSSSSIFFFRIVVVAVIVVAQRSSSSSEIIRSLSSSRSSSFSRNFFFSFFRNLLQNSSFF